MFDFEVSWDASINDECQRWHDWKSLITTDLESTLFVVQKFVLYRPRQYNLKLSRALTQNGIQNNVLQRFILQVALRS